MDTPEFDPCRRRRWVWIVAGIDLVVAVLVVMRFFYYVANDARISNSPPESELEDRISLLWTWFGFLAAYVCQLLMAIALVIGSKKNDTETVLGNCQLWIYGAHCLNVYTIIELLIILYLIFGVNYFEGKRAILVVSLAVTKLVLRIISFVVVKLFMADLRRPSCSCRVRQTKETAELENNPANLI